MNRLIRTGVPLVMMLLVAACGKNGGPPLDVTLDKPRLDAADSAVLKPCLGPVKVPDGPLTQKQVESYWGQDDDRLLNCAAQKRILVDYITARDGAISGQ